MPTTRSEAGLQSSLGDVRRLLDRHRILDTIAARQEGPKRDLLEDLQHRQNAAELAGLLRSMHAADIAYVLAGLALLDRQRVWEQLSDEQAGAVLVEVSDVVRDSLVHFTDADQLVRLLTTLDADDLAFVSDAVPPELLARASAALEGVDRSVFEDSIQYRDQSVGAFMTREWVAVSDSSTVEGTIAELRRRGALPPQTDRLFVVDARHVLVGTVPLEAILVQPPATPISGLIIDSPAFGPFDDAADAVTAFERYDLVSAPVVDGRGKLIGRLTVDAAMDVLRAQATLQALRTAGLREDEDLFAPPLTSARNRWPWLGVNLVTAFIASRVIGQFEATIAQMAPIAALMPIVASIGGNTGNQTMAIVIRALAGDRVQHAATAKLFRKELVVSLLNGALWGALVGLFAFVFYASAGLGVVMSTAVVLNLIIAALAGVAIPLLLHGTGRDPAQGASVLLTFVTDSMGFFLFLGLSSLLLV
jgi:magnesium transporter